MTNVLVSLGSRRPLQSSPHAEAGSQWHYYQVCGLDPLYASSFHRSSLEQPILVDHP